MHAENRQLERSRLGLVLSLIIIFIALAAAVSLLMPELVAMVPFVQDLDIRSVQVGLVLIAITFGFYTLEREMNFRRLAADLVSQRVSAARLSAELELMGRIQEERDTVSALLLSSADGICVVDKERRVIRLNPAMEQVLGSSGQDPRGLSCDDLLGCSSNGDGEFGCGSVCPFKRVLDSGEAVRSHLLRLERGDRELWLSGSFAPVRDADGAITYATASLRDVTRSKEIEQMQNDFVSIVSHELRGPLTAIKGFVQTLIRKGTSIPEDTRTDFLQTINEQAERLNQLVGDLLNVSRIDSRRLSLRLTPVDLEAMVNTLVAQFSAKWGDRIVNVEVEGDAPSAMADERKLEEILINLIDNAVKYSPAGGEINVSIRPTAEGLEVSVEDSGIGISPEDAANLFQKFHRVSSEQTRDIGGTGLGLYIVKGLVEAHGGRIWVTSAPDVGSTFTFTLPAADRQPAT